MDENILQQKRIYNRGSPEKVRATLFERLTHSQPSLYISTQWKNKK